MSGNDIAKRYAKAFFDIAVEEDKLEAHYTELTYFNELVEKNKEFQGYLANPLFDEENKVALIREITQKLSLSKTTSNFLSLLAEKKRINIVTAIRNSYEEMMDKALAKVRVNVKTAFPLGEATSASLLRALENLTRKKVEMNLVVDSSLLGGVVVKIGDTLYDGSIKTQLTNISNLLGEER